MYYVMNEMDNVSVCDKSLILHYKAELLLPHKEYDNAVKKLKKAVAEEGIGGLAGRTKGYL